MCDVICTTTEWNDSTEILFCLKKNFQFNSNFKIDVLLFESFLLLQNSTTKELTKTQPIIKYTLCDSKKKKNTG